MSRDQPERASSMALVLEMNESGWSRFWFSFVELVGFWAFGVGFSEDASIGSVGEFVERRVVQGGGRFVSPVFGRGVPGAHQEDWEGGPEAFAAQPSGRFVDEFGGLAAELSHQVVRHHRRQQFLAKRVQTASADLFGIQYHLQISEIDFDRVAAFLQTGDGRGRIGQTCDTVQRQFGADHDFVQTDFPRSIRRQIGVRLALFGRRFPGLRPHAEVVAAFD